MNPKKKTAITIFVAIVIVALVLLFLFSNGSGSQNAANSAAAVIVADTDTVATTTASTTMAQAQTVPPADAPKYKNGTYTAIGKYMSPAGPETINVSLTISNDIVTDATVTPLAPDAHSQRYQGYFISGYKQYVIGKSIDSINLTGDISGSSLTPKGFDDALTTIKAAALNS